MGQFKNSGVTNLWRVYPNGTKYVMYSYSAFTVNFRTLCLSPTEVIGFGETYGSLFATFVGGLDLFGIRIQLNTSAVISGV